MAIFPFERQKPSGYQYGEVPASDEWNAIDDNAASAASGAIWSDLCAGKTWLRSAALPNHGFALAWNQAHARWYSFGSDGVDIFGAYLPRNAPTWTTGLTITTGDGLLPHAAAASPGGIMVFGGKPLSSSTSKIRESTDGSTWNARATNASGTSAVRSLIWHSASSKFIAALDAATSANIETSSNGQSWTQITGLPDSLPRGSLATNGTTIVCASDTFGSDPVSTVITSEDGASWTQRTLPISGFAKGVAWDDYHGVFVLILGNRCLVSEDGISWTDVRSHNANALALVCHEVGRTILFAPNNRKLVYYGYYDEAAQRIRSSVAFEMADEFTTDQIAGSAIAVGNNQFMITDVTGGHYWSLPIGS